MDDKRREPRFRFDLAVTLIAGRRSWSLSTRDVSYRGMFVSVADPPRPRELVRVDVTLPDGATLTLHGMIAFVTQQGDETGRPAGAGIQFFGSGGQEHKDWDAFVEKVLGEQQRKKPKPRRTHPRVALVLRLNAKDTTELGEMVAASVAHGLFVETEHQLAIGSTMVLGIIHPHTGAAFDVACTVRRKALPTEGKGVGVELELSADRRRQLTAFIASGAPPPRPRTSSRPGT